MKSGFFVGLSRAMRGIVLMPARLNYTPEGKQLPDNPKKSSNMSEKNYCVIMAGGIGSRFWPYSRNHRPKQFLDFFGTGRSLLQQTVDRFRPLMPIENVLVVTNAMYRDTILEQIPDLKPEHILCEPARRNTAPCIAYALAHIRALTSDANIVVAPSDHLILNEPEFQRVIAAGLDFVEHNDTLLTLGMKPTRPETGYGYIQKMPGDGCLHEVKTFTEKPNYELAKVFYESGEFLWNSGIFLWNLHTIWQCFEEFLPDVAEIFNAGADKMATPEEPEFINKMFPACPSISIDYGVMEKAHSVHVMEADFGWSDLGTWGSLYELSPKDADGNVTLKSEALYYNAHGNVVTLESGKLVVVEGIDDCIVAESDGVLLICKKQDEQSIRQMVDDTERKFNGKYN